MQGQRRDESFPYHRKAELSALCHATSAMLDLSVAKRRTDTKPFTWWPTAVVLHQHEKAQVF